MGFAYLYFLTNGFGLLYFIAIKIEHWHRYSNNPIDKMTPEGISIVRWNGAKTGKPKPDNPDKYNCGIQERESNGRLKIIGKGLVNQNNVLQNIVANSITLQSLLYTIGQFTENEL